MFYNVTGDVVISDGVNVNIINGGFTLTCISTGGPATTVTWRRDSVTVTEGTETVLDDPVTAQYTHTLTVTGRLPGLYTCTVANDRPSNDLAYLTIEGNKMFLLLIVYIHLTSYKLPLCCIVVCSHLILCCVMGALSYCIIWIMFGVIQTVK